MQRPGRKCFGVFLALALIYLLIAGVVTSLSSRPSRRAYPSPPSENREWVATSESWLDRQLCTWLELCGTAHLNSKHWVDADAPDRIQLPPPPPSEPPPDTVRDPWRSPESQGDPESWPPDEREARDIPDYVLEHAPYVHLFSGEQFWPCDVAEHLLHTTPRLNYTRASDIADRLTPSNLDTLNDLDGGVRGRFVYLQSDDNVEERPRWLGGADNIPNAPEKLAPAVPDVTLTSDADQQLALVRPIQPEGATTGESSLPTLSPSPNGRCGGRTGFTCKGSGFGKCCSIYGWCGRGDDYCAEACDALAGACNDPFEPRPRPHSELRRRDVQDSASARHKPDPAGRSSAPAFLIVVKKEDGIVDAFWFFFYSFNLGQKVFDIRFGNHVGDWEHTMVRFRNGKPQAVFLSEHDFGGAYRWSALEKYLPDPSDSGHLLGTWSNGTAGRLAKRPVVYSAVGSHAMYGTPGVHPYILPWGLLHDQTDRGPLWDPTLNLHSYVYDPVTKEARSSTLDPEAPSAWLDYAGHWGDKHYPLSDPRQYRLAGQYHYVNGPTGPKFKNLGRTRVCAIPGRCRMRDWVGDLPDRRRRFPLISPDDDAGDGDEEGGLPGGNMTDEVARSWR